MRGRAIVIPGRNFSGKTSLVAALVKAGATYYSDEYAVLDERGRVHHYARPLSIRKNGHLAKPKKYQVETLGGRSGVKPLPVGMVVVSKYEAGARWRPRRLSEGEGALELMANTVSARRQPEAMLEAVRGVVSLSPVLKGGPEARPGRWLISSSKSLSLLASFLLTIVRSVNLVIERSLAGDWS